MRSEYSAVSYSLSFHPRKKTSNSLLASVQIIILMVVKVNVPFEGIQKLFIRRISHDDILVSQGLVLEGNYFDKWFIMEWKKTK